MSPRVAAEAGTDGWSGDWHREIERRYAARTEARKAVLQARDDEDAARRAVELAEANFEHTSRAFQAMFR